MAEEFRQKKFSSRIAFKFAPDGLAYEIEDKSGAVRTTVPYPAIPFETSEHEERSDYLRNLGVLFCIIGAVYALYVLLVINVDPSRLNWLRPSAMALPAGILCLLAHRILRTRYTVYDAENAKLFVMQDKNHDAIIGALERHRNKAYLEMHGEVDPDNDPSAEREKFVWLHERGVISEQQLRERLVLLREDDEGPGVPGGKHLH